jgi:3-dehydroquinate synthase
MANGARIFLVGFSGTGKSAVGRRVARMLGWDFADADELIVERAGVVVEKIFADEGEAGFRQRERNIIVELAARERVVVSVGGGAMVQDECRSAMLDSSLVVAMEARPETIFARLTASVGEAEGAEGMVRPMLAADGDPMERIEMLKRDRQWAYALAHYTMSTDYMSVEQVAHEVLQTWRRFGRPATWLADPLLAATVTVDSGAYPIYVGGGIIEKELGDRLLAAGISGRAFIICDSNVVHPYGRAAQRSINKAGIEVGLFTFPAGESSKMLATAAAIYQWLAERRVERRDMIVAVGGGVVGDVAGFVAATFLRGIKLVQVPTSMTAMVDSAIGGKTAVDLPQAKNLVGAFYHPELVLADAAALDTLPKRVLMEGWAEAIKTGFALDASLVETYETQTDALLALDRDLIVETIARNAAVKARIVTEDERETSGLRSLLNYGHTIGHGLEVAAGFDAYLHGEGVAIGMRGAAMIGMAMGVTPPELVERQAALLRRFGLPDSYRGAGPDAILEAMTHDKKAVAGKIAWVLLDEVGRSSMHSDVPWELAAQVVRDLRE